MGFFILETMEKDEKEIEKYLKIGNEILYNPELDCTEKILLAEIQSLHKLEKGCFASNEHFALLLGLKTPAAASKRISKLTKMGYITTKNVYGKSNLVGRVITPTFKKASEKSTESVPEHSKGSSIRNKVVPEEQEVSSGTTKDVVPTGIEGSSDTTREVVPTGQGGSSGGNTIYTYKETDLNDPLYNPLYYQYTGEIENLFDNKESSLHHTPNPEVGALDNWNKFPVEFYDVLDKREIQGWNSLSVKEARIFWDYKYKFNSFIDSNPDLSEHRII